MIAAAKPTAPISDNTALAANGHDSIVLEGISWQTYQALRWETPNDHLRMIYDNGRLEIMSPMKKHGRVVHYIGLMIYEWARVKRIAIDAGGNMTCDREDMEK